ncbi:hypothetical protein DS2_17557 [Catenovulum agarivorans DS-2]|uniref:Uncharacterized protein n=1 Tax=Catenovulum agarivorans DS-2 TaxID=1328313 RepID=W7Q8P5_9ALTE|nr:hypothetical protein [Catenovulum agarivorans]EWH08371.1 hypothetical protein DS2_17557 [Catenovulum agarivorans DS-2]
MDSIFIIAFAVSVLWLIAVVPVTYVKELLRFVGAVLPLILFMLGYIDNDGITIIFVGLCFFGFPVLSTSLLK